MKIRLPSWLRFLPVGLVGMLAVGWVVSLCGEFGYLHNQSALPGRYRRWSIEQGAVEYRYRGGSYPPLPSDIVLSSGWVAEGRWWIVQPKFVLGMVLFQVRRDPSGTMNYLFIQVPLLALITLLLPLAVGCLTGFRFRVWHWMAYTALVAAALAFYVPHAVVTLF